MKLTKSEEQTIQILRLCRKISVRHGEGYYSINNTPETLNTKYYLPRRGHKKFDTPEETIQSLRRLLKMSTVEYRYDINQMIEKINKLKEDKEEATNELKRMEKGYREAVKQLKNINGEINETNN